MAGEPDEQPLRLSRAQVRDIDRLAVERYAMPSIVLMENASRAVADVASEMVSLSGRHDVLILCGGGNNGGDGLAVARHLHNRGLSVSIGLTVDPGKYTGDALINWRIVEAMGLPTASATSDSIIDFASGLVVDAIFGTGLSQPPRAGFEEIATALVTAGCSVLAVDLPSGLDCDTGEPLDRDACIRAHRTVTFVAEKIGFANPRSKEFTGEVTVGDIGCPRELIDAVARAGAGGGSGGAT